MEVTNPKNVVMQLGSNNRPVQLQLTDATLQYLKDDKSAGKPGIVTDIVNQIKKDEGFSLDVLEKFTTGMSSLNEKMAGAIVDFKPKAIASNKGMSYNLVVKDYLGFRVELLCFYTDLESFIDSARQSHSYIESVVEQCNRFGFTQDAGKEEARKIVNVLNNVKGSSVNKHSGEKMFERASSLLKKQDDMLATCSLLEEESTPGEDQKTTNGWRKVLNYVITGVKCVFVAIFGMIATADYLTVKFGSWVKYFLFFEELVALYELWRKDKMEKGANLPTLCGLKEMGDIHCSIHAVISAIESLITLGKTIAKDGDIKVGIANIKRSLNKFFAKIQGLEKKTEECYSNVLEARNFKM